MISLKNKLVLFQYIYKKKKVTISISVLQARSTEDLLGCNALYRNT